MIMIFLNGLNDHQVKDRNLISVFMPGTLNSNMDFLLSYERNQIKVIAMNGEEAFKCLVSIPTPKNTPRTHSFLNQGLRLI